MDLHGSTAIVTGAAHRVGKGIAEALANQDCNIIVHYGRSESKAKQTVSELRDLGVEAQSYSADLGNPEEIASFFKNVNSSFDYSILVNSAASFVKKGLLETSLDDWDKSLNINARAPLLTIQHATPVLKKQNDSLIVNIADLSGKYAWKNFAAHGMSKAALLHLTRIAARELAPEIRVNAILPGPILPPPDMEETDSMWSGMIENIPLQRSGFPSQVGQTVVFFATNSFVSGTVVPVDGGESLVGPRNH